ncbi:MAG: hypothetical protein WC447_01140 [Candidatus Paceibacterota bacterium]|jgi:hypothetical protein
MEEIMRYLLALVLIVVIFFLVYCIFLETGTIFQKIVMMIAVIISVCGLLPRLLWKTL